MEKIERFQHEALNLTGPSIRVVEILPPSSDDNDSIITCSLREIPLKAASHTCLSYVCGGLNEDGSAMTILVNGRRLSVLPNLWSFLHQARAMKILEPMWIDAISIDQRNIQERNRQVRQMSDIYTLAKHVIVYPGPIEWERVTLSFEEAKRIGIDLDLSQAEINSTHPQPLDPSILFRARVMYLFHHHLIREYFGRLWIVQEILLSKNRSIIVSGQLISWDGFVGSMMAYWYNVERWLTAEQLRTRNAITATRQAPGARGLHEDLMLPKFLQLMQLSTTGREKKLPFADLLDIVHLSDCSEPRDTVYGLLGLVQNGCNMPVDYTRPKEEIFLDALEILIPATSEDVQRDFLVPCHVLSLRLEGGVGALCKQCATGGADLQQIHTLSDEQWAIQEMSYRSKSDSESPALPVEFMMTLTQPFDTYMSIDDTGTMRSFDGGGYCRKCRLHLLPRVHHSSWPPTTIKSYRESPTRLWITISRTDIPFQSRVQKTVHGGARRLKTMFQGSGGRTKISIGQNIFPDITAPEGHSYEDGVTPNTTLLKWTR